MDASQAADEPAPDEPGLEAWKPPRIFLGLFLIMLTLWALACVDGMRGSIVVSATAAAQTHDAFGCHQQVNLYSNGAVAGQGGDIGCSRVPGAPLMVRIDADGFVDGNPTTQPMIAVIVGAAAFVADVSWLVNVTVRRKRRRRAQTQRAGAGGTGDGSSSMALPTPRPTA